MSSPTKKAMCVHMPKIFLTDSLLTSTSSITASVRIVACQLVPAVRRNDRPITIHRQPATRPTLLKKRAKPLGLTSVGLPGASAGDDLTAALTLDRVAGEFWRRGGLIIVVGGLAMACTPIVGVDFFRGKRLSRTTRRGFHSCP